MTKANSKQPEKCHLISREDIDKKNESYKKALSATILVLIVIFVTLLLINSFKKYKFFNHLLDNKDSPIKKNYLSSQESVIKSRKVHKCNKVEGEDECNKTRTLQNNSTAIPSFCDGCVYFIKNDEVMTDQEACALESVLHFNPNKTHLIEFLCNRPKELDEGINFIKLLQDSYSNLVFTSIEGNIFFKGTPIEGHWKCDNNVSMFEAKVLTLWLHGGAIMSFDVLLNVPEVLTCSDQYFSQYVMVSKKKCNSFLFTLMKQLSPTKHIVIADVLQSEISNYKKIDGKSHVKYVDNKTICNHFSSACAFLVAEEVKKTTGVWSAHFAQLCPLVIKQFHNKSPL